MRLAKNLLWVFFLLPILFLNSAFGNVTDDETPEVTARVARISFLRGDVQIKHADSQDWERATGNLPIVEGDEIAAGSNARLEIQFDSRSFLRLAENSYLKIMTLRDEGIALSLPSGTLSLRVLEFEKERGYFEIDAPDTTITVLKAGMYRVDAGDKNEKQVRVSVTDDGQARIYSESSGFILRNGRSARIFLDGSNAGEWETTDASRYADDFDSWAVTRDAIIAKRLQKADYDKYYDRDIYGAEDLNDYGEWIHTKKYGYVWKPYRSATASYSDWSPYRYGQWRWIPPYGWTWVNDEPWGWATYHHGRWIYDRGWYWTPYGQHRGRRSWWSPALVIITHIANNICWYPLPYHYGYYDYNRRRRNHTTIINNNNIIVVNPTPTPRTAGENRRFERLPVEFDVPPNGVVAVSVKNFGKGRRDFEIAPPKLASDVLSKSPLDIRDSPVLPNHKDFKDGSEILVDNPRNERTDRQVRTGAGVRKIGVSMDDNLRKERIHGNRPPVDRSPPNESKENVEVIKERRNTGAVRREPRPVVRQDNHIRDIRESPRETPPEEPPIRPNIRESPREAPPEEPSIRPTNRRPDTERRDKPADKPRENNREKPPPSYSPPQKRDREEQRDEPPRHQPPPRPDPPKQESKPQPERKSDSPRSNERKEKPDN